MASVRVAVRVRPFNQREKDMNAFLCIGMEGVMTTITHPETKEAKPFAFDFSYWSHDRFKEQGDGELVGTDDKYATQRRVYNDVGQDCLNSAFDGYNSTLFAYGQTGSGKSYSMVGYGVNKGIIPIACSEMFKAVERGAAEGKKYQVSVTMLEIYNEVIRDLLNPEVNGAGGLKIRSQPGVGVYVEKLTPMPVRNYGEVEAQMEVGTTHRTVAATKMNATSSRAHTVFGINFTQISSVDGQQHETTAKVNLVDLAGSERADSTGATGDRLKEGSAINQSLSALGNVISALADISSGKKKVFVPYRNSALTRLLQDALGGNSRTIMICALSPADVNFDETLSTLRYADRAKKIKNKLIKNENPSDKIIRMLKEENARLIALLQQKGITVPAGFGDGDGADGAAAGGGGGGGGANVDELRAKMAVEYEAKLNDQLAENERMIGELKKSWEEKLRDGDRIKGNQTQLDDGGATTVRAAQSSKLPYLINLHEDSQLSECVVYLFKAGKTRIGKKGGAAKQDIVLNGLSIAAEHAVAENKDGAVTLAGVNKSKTFVNGDTVNSAARLHTGDRVIFGNNFVFRFIDPSEQASAANSAKLELGEHAYSDAIEELSTKQGLKIAQSLSGESAALEKEEAAKRKELEDKLRAMEELMRKEREAAMSAIEGQKRAFYQRLSKGDQITDDEKRQMAALEDQVNKKSRGLEEEIAKRRELSEKMLQETMKRKRQTKKIEEKLAKLVPLINEANQLSDELAKRVKFEARLAVKNNTAKAAATAAALDGASAGSAKFIEILIRVTNSENGNVWTWSANKFENRLFMMREIYQEFVEYGPKEIAKARDPFWDPPEAIEIGKAYIYLKALSQLVEIESEFPIVDYKGEEQGALRVEIFPEGVNGEDLDYLAAADELHGMSVVFIVRVPQATGLPSTYANDVYVQFTFHDQSFETPPHDGKSAQPKWKFDQRIRIENIGDDFVQYLLKDAAVFEVRGFTDAQLREAREARQAQKSAYSLARQRSYTAKQADALCQQCEEQAAHFECKDCALRFCESCFALLHKSAKKAAHQKVAFDASQTAAGSKCGQCDEAAPTVHCVECDKKYCDDCNALLHKAPRRAAHARKPV